MTFPEKFPHRHNKDGSYDSICTECFMTVASRQSEWQLAPLESAHVCDPSDLYWLSKRQIGADRGGAAIPSLIQNHEVRRYSALQG